MNLIKEITKGLLPEEEKKVVAVYGGGFKPPTKGHFQVVKQAIEEKKYAGIAEAFSPVAIACLQDKLSEEHKLCVLIYADSCVDEDESKLPILYKFLRFCLAIHIFSEDFILRTSNIPTGIKKSNCHTKNT